MISRRQCRTPQKQMIKGNKDMRTTLRMKIKTGAFALALTMVANVTLAQYPPASHLATRWWQWAFETPASENPLTDTTGQFAAVNQRGRVWFLAGNPGGTTVRTITVPSGKALFFPIVNVFDVEDAIIAGGVKLFLIPKPVQVAQTVVANIIATATGLSCEVDGSPVPITAANLEQSSPFSLHLPADNILGVPAGFIIRRLIRDITFCFPRCLPGSTPSTWPARSRSSPYRSMWPTT